MTKNKESCTHLGDRKPQNHHPFTASQYCPHRCSIYRKTLKYCPPSPSRQKNSLTRTPISTLFKLLKSQSLGCDGDHLDPLFEQLWSQTVESFRLPSTQLASESTHEIHDACLVGVERLNFDLLKRLKNEWKWKLGVGVTSFEEATFCQTDKPRGRKQKIMDRWRDGNSYKNARKPKKCTESEIKIRNRKISGRKKSEEYKNEYKGPKR